MAEIDKLSVGRALDKLRATDGPKTKMAQLEGKIGELDSRDSSPESCKKSRRARPAGWLNITRRKKCGYTPLHKENNSGAHSWNSFRDHDPYLDLAVGGVLTVAAGVIVIAHANFPAARSHKPRVCRPIGGAALLKTRRQRISRREIISDPGREEIGDAPQHFVDRGRVDFGSSASSVLK